MDQLGVSIVQLEKRCQLLRTLRQFFFERDFVEVETPALAAEVIPEQHIDPVAAVANNRGQRFLQASPELHMKRLVAAGMPAIFQISKCFRADELGPHHHPEFTMVEWYRAGDDMQAGMELLDELCRATLGTGAAKRTSYAEAFERSVGVCPHTAKCKQLADRARELGVAVPETLQIEDRDEWLNLLLAMRVEPELGREVPEILYDYPASQAALAKVAVRENGQPVAERFELYWHGVELANGYHELTDADELRQRLESTNQSRLSDGRLALPLPETLLAAMDAGLPACAGCALGFDRLAMLALGETSIDKVMAFKN